MVAQDSFIFSLPLLVAIDSRNEKNARPAIVSRVKGLLGVPEGPGTAALRAVVVTPMLTMAGVEPDRTTGAPGPLQVACWGAPVQVMVTFNEPVAPATSASCKL
jgi:hypothetical protein